MRRSPSAWRAARPGAPYLAGGSIGLTSPQSLEMNLPLMSFWMCMVIFGLTMSAAVLTVNAASLSSV